MKSITAGSGPQRYICDEALGLLDKEFPDRNFASVYLDDHGVAVKFHGKKLSHEQLDGLDLSKVTFLLGVGGHYQALSVKNGMTLCPILLLGRNEREMVVGEYNPPAAYTLLFPELLSAAAAAQPANGESSGI